MRDDERKMMVEMTWEEFKKWEEFKRNNFQLEDPDLFALFDRIRERSSYHSRITGKNSDTIVTTLHDWERGRRLEIVLSEDSLYNGKFN